jgi:hypothetical protein
MDFPPELQLKLLQESPLLRRLSLRDRRDADAILRRVRRSNRPIETLETEGYRGAVRRHEVNGGVLTRIVEGFQKLCKLFLTETAVKISEFCRMLVRLKERIASTRIGCTSRGYTRFPG